MKAKDLARSASGSHLVARVKKAGVVAPWNQRDRNLATLEYIAYTIPQCC